MSNIEAKIKHRSWTLALYKSLFGSKSTNYEKKIMAAIMDNAIDSFYSDMYELKMKADAGDNLAKRTIKSVFATYKKNGTLKEYIKRMSNMKV